MSRGYKFSNFDNFQSVENMNQTIRNQQYAYNGRMFIPPSTERFSMDEDIGMNGLSKQNQYRYTHQGLIPPIEADESVKPYELYKNSNSQQNTSVDIISNIVVPNALSRTFFSNDNMERIQQQVINEVYKKSQKKINKQSYQELQIIMKSIYLQYSRNLPTNIEEQVLTLNKYVVNECVPIIVNNVLQYNKYIQDITSPIPVMPRSVNASSKGERALPGTASLI
jgi:hypothetical protein